MSKSTHDARMRSSSARSTSIAMVFAKRRSSMRQRYALLDCKRKLAGGMKHSASACQNVSHRASGSVTVSTYMWVLQRNNTSVKLFFPAHGAVYHENTGMRNLRAR